MKDFFTPQTLFDIAVLVIAVMATFWFRSHIFMRMKIRALQFKIDSLNTTEKSLKDKLVDSEKSLTEMQNGYYALHGIIDNPPLFSPGDDVCHLKVTDIKIANSYEEFGAAAKLQITLKNAKSERVKAFLMIVKAFMPSKKIASNPKYKYVVFNNENNTAELVPEQVLVNLKNSNNQS